MMTLLLGAVTCGTRQVSAIKRLAVGVIRGVGVGDALRWLWALPFGGILSAMASVGSPIVQ